MWLWNRDSEFTKWQHPAMWYMALGWYATEFAQTSAILEFYIWFPFPHITAVDMSFCRPTSLQNFIQIGPPSAEKNYVMLIFKMAYLSHLGVRDPIMGSLKSPCTTSYKSLIETIALNCLVFFEKIAFFCILATDRQTDKQLRLNNNLRSCVSGATCEVIPVFSYLLLDELAVCWNHCFRKVVSYDMRLSRHRYSESRFWSFLSNTKTGLISICLLHMDVQASTKSYQLQEGGEGAKQPPDKGSVPGSRWGLRPYPQL